MLWNDARAAAMFWGGGDLFKELWKWTLAVISEGLDHRGCRGSTVL